MPNGDEKNWSRFCFALAGFRQAHGAWPTRISLPEDYIREIREHLLTPESFQRVQEKILIVARDGDIVAEDSSGRSYTYGTDWPDPCEAEKWLGVTADRLCGKS